MELGGRDNEASIDASEGKIESDNSRSRRTFVGAGCTLALGAISGCTDYISDVLPEQEGQRDNNENGNGIAPDLPTPAFFWSDWAEATFSTDLLYAYDGGDFDLRLQSNRQYNRFHPDTQAFDVSLDGTSLDVSFNAVITREVNLVAHLVSPAWDDNHTDEDFVTASPRVYEHALEPTTSDDTDGEDIDALHKPHNFSFDVSDLDFPRDVNVHAHIVLEDPEKTEDRFTLLKHHVALHLNYRTPAGSQSRWMNNGRLRPLNAREFVEGAPQIVGFAASHIRTFTENGHAITYAAILEDGEFWAATYSQNEAEIQEYFETYEHDRNELLRVANDANTDPAMRAFAQQAWDAQTTIGITDIYDRVNAIGDLAQALPYRSNAWEGDFGYRNHKYCLYANRGLCSEKTALFAAILRAEPFDIRVAYIACELVDYGAHMVVGVDKSHLQGSDHDISNLKSLNPSDYPDSKNGVPNGDYAFLDPTEDASLDVGDYLASNYEIEHFIGTNYGEGSQNGFGTERN